MALDGIIYEVLVFLLNVATLLWEECEDETHTPEMGTWESSRTPKSSYFDCKGQNTLHSGVLYIIEKLLKCRCPKWARMTHLDIWNTSYGQKRGRDHGKSGIDPIPLRAGGMQHVFGKLLTRATTLVQTSSQSEVCTRSYSPAKLQDSQPWRFRDSHLGVPGQKAIWMPLLRSGAEYIIWGKVVASLESRPWWILWVQNCPWLVLAPKVLQKVN
jgi:hypothetical protein